MNKAKAIFSGMMVLLIAGASGAMWYLNEKGIIGNDSAAQPDSYVEQEVNDPQYVKPDNGNNKNDGEKETTTLPGTDNESDKAEINEFLTVFAKLYFSESSEYTPGSRSTYELIRFAYSHIKRTDSSLIETRKEDDSIGYYNCVSAEKVNEVLREYLDVTVPAESVYTANDYAFFKYSGGYFMAPAADGLPFVNEAVCDTVEWDGDLATVRFAILSDGEVYADGEAQVKKTDDGLVLVYYNIEK